MKQKTCLKCNEVFCDEIVNGVKRNIQHRKFCWACSPFGEGNNRNLSRTSRTCPRCEKDLSLDEYYPKAAKHQSGKLYSFCKLCTRLYNKERRLNIKQKSVEYKGGKCSRCAYNRCLWALEFHHLDPSKKDINIAHCHVTFEKLKIELDKCILVCSNCHREIHSELGLN